MPHSTFDTKTLQLVAASTASSATQTASIDLRGFGNCCLSLYVNTTHVPLALKVEESDDNSTWAAANMTGGTHFTLAGVTATNEANTVFDVNCVGRKRYLKLTVTPGTTNLVCAYATLGRSANGVERNAAVVVNANA